jgi:hypothetical protein
MLRPAIGESSFEVIGINLTPDFVYFNQQSKTIESYPAQPPKTEWMRRVIEAVIAGLGRALVLNVKARSANAKRGR